MSYSLCKCFRRSQEHLGSEDFGPVTTRNERMDFSEMYEVDITSESCGGVFPLMERLVVRVRSAPDSHHCAS